MSTYNGVRFIPSTC